MPKLILMRHGSALNASETITDINRPLSALGKDQAAAAAKLLMLKKHKPQVLVTSPAKRALETCTIAAEIWQINSSSIYIEENLYGDADENEVFSHCLKHAAAAEDICFFGHNPEWSHLAWAFSQGLVTAMDTADAVVCEWQITEWKKAEPKKGKLLYFTGEEKN